jgi:hypothetical protein
MLHLLFNSVLVEGQVMIVDNMYKNLIYWEQNKTTGNQLKNKVEMRNKTTVKKHWR